MKLLSTFSFIISISMMTVLSCSNGQTKYRNIIFPYGNAENIDEYGINEPSGIVFHENSNTLFVVGDEGDIVELDLEGNILKQHVYEDVDFEGITFDPLSGLLYAAVEGEEVIMEINPENLWVLREFRINRKFRGNTVLSPDGDGIEAIAFVSDLNHPEGGTFFIANQGFDLENDEDPSALFEVEVPLISGNNKYGEARIIQQISIGVIDLSGLHYNARSGNLYVISDTTNTFFEVTLHGKIIQGFALPGDDQEGITFDFDRNVYIAQDCGGVIKLSATK